MDRSISEDDLSTAGSFQDEDEVSSLDSEYSMRAFFHHTDSESDSDSDYADDISLLFEVESSPHVVTLNEAAASGSLVETVDRLLRQDEESRSPRDINHMWVWAVKKGCLDVLTRLQCHDNGVSEIVRDVAIRLAAQEGHLEIVDHLVQDQRVDPSIFNNGALRDACRHGHFDIVLYLLEDPRVDPSSKRNDVVRVAARHGHMETIHRLVQDPRIYRIQRFRRLPPEVKEEALRLFQNDALPFDFIAALRPTDVQNDDELRAALEDAHDRALATLMSLLRSDSFGNGLASEDMQIVIVWQSLGFFLFPLLPLKARHNRIARLVSCLNARGKQERCRRSSRRTSATY